MEEKAKEKVLALLEEAENYLSKGENEKVAAKIAEAKNEIKPLPGTGSNGDIH